MKVIPMMNLKGGVGKTSSTVNAAATLALDYRQRVLVVDGDSQCNTTEFFCAQNGHTQSTFADLLRGTATGDAIRPSKIEGIDLLPADDSLMDLDLSKVEGQLVDVTCLKKLRGSLAERYDWVLIDCPPAFNAAAAAALLAADAVVIPIKLDAFSLRGMSNLQRQIHNMKRLNPELKIAGFLPTMAYKSNTIDEAERMLRGSGLHVFPSIRRSGPVDAMTFSQVPLILSSPKSAACQDYRRFVEELAGPSPRKRRARTEGGEQHGV